MAFQSPAWGPAIALALHYAAYMSRTFILYNSRKQRFALQSLQAADGLLTKTMAGARQLGSCRCASSQGHAGGNGNMCML